MSIPYVFTIVYIKGNSAHQCIRISSHRGTTEGCSHHIGCSDRRNPIVIIGSRNRPSTITTIHTKSIIKQISNFGWCSFFRFLILIILFDGIPLFILSKLIQYLIKRCRFPWFIITLSDRFGKGYGHLGLIQHHMGFFHSIFHGFCIGCFSSDQSIGMLIDCFHIRRL